MRLAINMTIYDSITAPPLDAALTTVQEQKYLPVIWQDITLFIVLSSVINRQFQEWPEPPFFLQSYLI